MYSVFTKRFTWLLLVTVCATGCGTVSVPFMSGGDAGGDTGGNTDNRAARTEQNVQTTEVARASENGTSAADSQSESSTALVAPPKLTPIPRLKQGNEALFVRATELMAAGKFDSAEVLLTELTESQPELAGPWINLGLIRAAQDDLPGAQSALFEAVQANPANCDARNQLGIVLRKQGNFAAAAEQYQACIDLNPTRADVYLNLGILNELYMGNLQGALQAYSQYQALSVQPDQQVAGWVADLERRVAAIAKR